MAAPMAAMQASSPIIRETLSQVPEPTATRVVVPPIAGMSPTRQHDMFVMATEHAAR